LTAVSHTGLCHYTPIFGYGDVTPTTTTGRVIARTLGTMGVITLLAF